ncbi:MAG: hypothetical protein AAF126_21045, partial [Chloroflexota bacterium]
MKNTLRLIIIGMIVALAVVAFAQDATTPAEPLSEEDTLALLSDTGMNIFPLDVIIDNPPILVGLNATSTTIELITNIPTNCLVLFGTTPDFGRASQDANMADLFTEDHLPFLGNLEPETTYYYRLQGSDANGNFYVSEIFT